MKTKKMLPILLIGLIFIGTMPINAANNDCSSCKDTDLTTGAMDVNLYSLYSYFHSKNIPVICVKLSPKGLKESYLAQYVDGNNSYFIYHGSKTIKTDKGIITVNPDKFTGYAIIIGDKTKKINNTPLSKEEMNKIQGKTNINSISGAIAACIAFPPCEAALVAACAALGYSIEWCATNPEECYAKWHHIICSHIDCSKFVPGTQ